MVVVVRSPTSTAGQFSNDETTTTAAAVRGKQVAGGVLEGIIDENLDEAKKLMLQLQSLQRGTRIIQEGIRSLQEKEDHKGSVEEERKEREFRTTLSLSSSFSSSSFSLKSSSVDSMSRLVSREERHEEEGDVSIRQQERQQKQQQQQQQQPCIDLAKRRRQKSMEETEPQIDSNRAEPAQTLKKWSGLPMSRSPPREVVVTQNPPIIFTGAAESAWPSIIADQAIEGAGYGDVDHKDQDKNIKTTQGNAVSFLKFDRISRKTPTILPCWKSGDRDSARNATIEATPDSLGASDNSSLLDAAERMHDHSSPDRCSLSMKTTITATSATSTVSQDLHTSALLNNSKTKHEERQHISKVIVVVKEGLLPNPKESDPRFVANPVRTGNGVLHPQSQIFLTEPLLPIESENLLQHQQRCVRRFQQNQQQQKEESEEVSTLDTFQLPDDYRPQRPTVEIPNVQLKKYTPPDIETRAEAARASIEGYWVKSLQEQSDANEFRLKHRAWRDSQYANKRWYEIENLKKQWNAEREAIRLEVKRREEIAIRAQLRDLLKEKRKQQQQQQKEKITLVAAGSGDYQGKKQGQGKKKDTKDRKDRGRKKVSWRHDDESGGVSYNAGHSNSNDDDDSSSCSDASFSSSNNSSVGLKDLVDWRAEFPELFLPNDFPENEKKDSKMKQFLKQRKQEVIDYFLFWRGVR